MIEKPISRRPRAAKTEAPVEMPSEPVTIEVTKASGAARVAPMALIVAVVVLIGVVALAGTKYFESKREGASVQTSQADIRSLIEKVSAHLVVNPNENPTVATIQDANALRTQNPIFYKDAQNGDRLLIWSDKAVLYSPREDKILSVLPIAVAGSTTTSATTPSASPAIGKSTVEVRNGSGAAGLAKSTATTLKNLGFTVSSSGDAKSKTPYAKSVIVVANQSALETAQALAKATGASIATLPSTESPLKSDILLLLGLDAKK